MSGGVKRYIQQKISYIRTRSASDEHVLIVPGESDNIVGDERARTYTIRSPLLSKTSRYRALLRLKRIEHILAEEKPDIIESGDPYQVAWKALASGRRLGIPVVAFYHSHFPEAYLRSVAEFFGRTATEFAMDISRRYIRNLYSRFARTFVPSPALGALLTEWGVRNVVNIDLGVDPDIFRPDPAAGVAARTRLGIADDKILLLYIGRLAREKNTHTLFEAFKLLNAGQPQRFHLLIVGEGLQRELLQKLQRQTGAVTWLPYCADSTELANLYRAADFFVHPGVQETFGLVTLESQACGTPVVGIRGSYMDRIIYSDQSHWAQSNSPRALADAIARCSRDEKAPDLSAQVAKLYSWERILDRLFNVYREVITEYKKP